MWYVYILECNDGSLYTGITTDPARRVTEHNSSPKGARFTKGRCPVRLIYTKEMNNRSEATREEMRIKHLSRKEKLGMAGQE